MPEGTLTTTNSNKKLTKCSNCGLSINDQYIYKVAPDLQWHEKCLKCVECNKSLEENSKCYIKNNKAYCKDDYFKLFSLKCFRCGLILKSNDMVMKCKMLIYHYDCFNCDICNKKFQPGDEYLIKNNNLLVCKEDSINTNNEVQQKQIIQLNRVTSTPASSLTVNTNYRNLINSDDSSFSPSVSSSSIESSLSINHINIVNNNNNINNNPNNGTYETSSYSPLSVNYNSYSNTDHNSNDYNYQSLRDDDDDNTEDDDSSSEKDLNLLNYNHNKHNSHHNFSSSSSSSKNIGSKPARVRTVLNEKQLHTLRACYGANPRPDALMKEQLVEMTGLSPRVIRVWFQNKRCKDKKKTLLNRQGDSNQQQQHILFERCY